ncbi:MAG: hypothetical protein OEV64_04330 [Desulfobulbaceae bacterium]|nr:hypothetical protein [Desulfobulbaceae bacterium]
MMQADNFFSNDEKTRISEAIKEVETNTSGEVAVMVVDQSDKYPEAIMLGGILLGCLGSLLITDIFFLDSLWHFLPLAFGLALLSGILLNKLPQGKLPFISRTVLEERVRDRALRAFYEQQLYKTRDNTGVLFFLSLFEHKVWVLADEGIYQKIDQKELNGYALEVAASVKQGKAAEGLCREIARIGKILAHHFPIKDDDSNELSNEVITG